MSWSASGFGFELAPVWALKWEVLLTVLGWCFFYGSFMLFFLSCVRYAVVRVCLFVPCGRLLGGSCLLALVCGV